MTVGGAVSLMSSDAQIARQWAAVPGYEGYYEVSTLGEVRSLDRKITFSNADSYYDELTEGTL